jgi:hypothetical protein
MSGRSRKKRHKSRPKNTNGASTKLAPWYRTMGKLPRWVWTAAIVVVPSLIAYLSVPPSLQLDLPSTADRMGNPYTALFTLTNTGWASATSVTVHCLVNDVEYVVPKDVHSSGLPTAADVGTIAHDEKRTFNCPQLVSYAGYIPKALTPNEVWQFEQYLRSHAEDERGRWIGPDMKFAWIDLEFDATYRFITGYSRKFRVVGHPGDNGAFVWRQVPLDERFDEAHKKHPEWSHD